MDYRITVTGISVRRTSTIVDSYSCAVQLGGQDREQSQLYIKLQALHNTFLHRVDVVQEADES